MQDRRYKQALPLFAQNINNNAATADDYIQKANCLLYMRNDKEAYKEVMQLISQAKAASPNNINIYRTEIIALLRQDKYAEARTLLGSYSKELHLMLDNNSRPEPI